MFWRKKKKNDGNLSVNYAVDDDSKKDNEIPYKDFLPENRFKDENLLSPKMLKFFLYFFYAFAAVVVVVVGINFFYGVDFLSVDARNYNMNLTETINLDTIYSSPSVVWETDSDIVTIENNVIIAKSEGEAYIIAREGDEQVTDIMLTVLSADTAMYIDSHSVQIGMGDSHKVTVSMNDDDDDWDDDDWDDDDWDDDDWDDDDWDDDDWDDDDWDDDDWDDDDWDDDDWDDDDWDDDDWDDDDWDDDDWDDDDLTYESSDESVATVDSSGNIATVSPGTTIITVTDSEGNEDHAYITVSSDDIQLYSDEYNLNVGETVNVEYTLVGSNYTTSDLSWKSSDKSVATVDDNGTITAVGVGETNIIVTVGSLEKKVKVTVSSNLVLPSSLSLSTESISVMVGDSQTIAVSIEPNNVTDSSISWVSDDENIATVSDGIAVGKSAGSTVISATTVNGIRKEVRVEVTKKVVEDEDIVLENTELNLEVGEKTTISYSVLPSSTTDQSVQYDYDSNFLSIDSSGNLKALKAGITYVTVTTKNNHSATMKVTIITSASSSEVSFIEIQEGDLNLTKGGSQNLTVSILPDDAANKEVTWKSSNTSVASVSSSGKVTANGVGEAIITVTSSSGGVSDSITVKVIDSNVSVSSLSVTPTSSSLKAGKTQTLSVTISPSNATNKTITWTSSDSSVATVDQNGVVTAISKGTATISAKTNDGSNITASSTISVSYNVSMALDTTSKSINVGDNFTLSATVLPDGASQSVTWTSSDTSVVTVNSKGVVTGKAEGTAYITATSVEDSSVAVRCKVVVSSKSVTSLKSSVSEKVLEYGEKYTLSITVSPSNASNKELTYVSSDKSIATVSSKGVVTAQSKMGVATITIKSKDNTSVKTTVKVVTVPSSGYNGEEATSYTSLKKLGILSPTKQISIESSDGTYRWAQGFCVAEDYYLAAQVDSSSKYAYISVYNKKTGKLIQSFKEAFGHANGMTYNSDDGKIYIARAGESSDSDSTYGDEHRIYYSFAESGVTSSSLSIKKGGFYNSKTEKYISFGGLAYDEETQLYYLSNGSKVYVYNPDTKKIVRTITKVYTGTTQDISAYHGLVFVIRFDGDYSGSSTDVQKTRNAIDIYRVSDGAYLGSYIVKTGDKFELEGLDYYGSGNKFALYFHVSGGYTSYIYTVDISL